MSFCRSLLPLTVILAVAACSPASKNEPKDSGAPKQTSASVGATGGTLSNGGSSLSIPPGALPGDTTITDTETPDAPVPAGSKPVGTAYTFGPEGQQFTVPVTITLEFDPSLLPAGRTAADIVVYTAPAGSTQYTSLGGTLVDATHIAAQTTHFSTFLPGVATGATDGGTDGGNVEIDGGNVEIDGGNVEIDGGNVEIDGGTPETDGGHVDTDAGHVDTDAGTPETDGGAVEHDAGTPDVDAGSETDGGIIGVSCGEILDCTLSGIDVNVCSAQGTLLAQAEFADLYACIDAECPTAPSEVCENPNDPNCQACLSVAIGDGPCAGAYATCTGTTIPDGGTDGGFEIDAGSPDAGSNGGDDAGSGGNDAGVSHDGGSAPDAGTGGDDAGQPNGLDCLGIYDCVQRTGDVVACEQQGGAPAQSAFDALYTCLAQQCSSAPGQVCETASENCRICQDDALHGVCAGNFETCVGSSGNDGGPDGGTIACAGIPFAGEPVAAISHAEAVPAFTGGTVANGLYALTGLDLFNGESLDMVAQQTISIEGSRFAMVIAGANGPEQYSGSISAAEGYVTITFDCPGPGEITLAYTATETQLITSDPDDANAVRTFTLATNTTDGGFDGGTDGGTAGVTCAEIFHCQQASGSVETCVGLGTPDAQREFEALYACVADACPGTVGTACEDPNSENCHICQSGALGGACSSLYDACLSDTGTIDGGTPDGGGNDGGTTNSCGGVAFTGEPVPFVASGDPMPTFTGGVVADGIYTLTSATLYNGETRDGWAQQTLIVSGGRFAMAVADNNSPNADQSEGTVSTAENTLTLSFTCPGPGIFNIAYTATETQLIAISPMDQNEVRVFTRTGSVPDGGLPDAGTPDGGTADGGTTTGACDNVQFTGEPVAFSSSADAPPTFTGGALVDGTYTLTGATLFNGGTRDGWVRQTIVVSNGQISIVLTDNSSNAPQQLSGKVSTDGTSMTIDIACPGPTTFTLQYTATETQITSTSPGDPNEVRVFTLTGPVPDGGTVDGGTDGGTSGVSCGEMVGCLSHGGTVEACAAGGTPEAQSAFTDLIACVDAACPSTPGAACETLDSVQCQACQQGATTTACASQWDVCTTGSTGTDGGTDGGMVATCGDVFNCVQAGGTEQACTAGASAEAVNEFKSLSTCVDSACPGAPGSICENLSSEACQQCEQSALYGGACSDSYSTCTGDTTAYAQCGAPAIQGGQIVATSHPEAPPMLAGGTLVDGTYVLTAVDGYNDATVDGSMQWVIVISGDTLYENAVSTNNPQGTGVSGLFSVADGIITLNASCPSIETSVTSYAATSDQLFLQDARNPNVIYTFALAPVPMP